MKYLTIMTVIFALLSSMPGCSSEPTIHQVTFDSNGGGAVPSVNVTDGAGIEKPHDPAKPGYSFKGWYRQNDYQHEWDFSTDVVTADLTLHAKWEAESYTVTFDAQGGDAPDPTAKEVVFDQAYGELANTTKTGYRLVGWTTKPNGGGSSVDASTICTRTEDHTLYAKWEPTVPFIGEAGGLVFYENPNHETDGWRYLEAAPKGWNGEDTDPMVIFGYYRPQGGVAEKTGANGREIGDGLLNTQILVDKMGETAYISGHSSEPGTTNQYAARICLIHDGNYFSDWYLPSKEELGKLYTYANENDGYNEKGDYWSSTEWNASTAYKVNFDGGSHHILSKSDECYIRPIRKY